MASRDNTGWVDEDTERSASGLSPMTRPSSSRQLLDLRCHDSAVYVKVLRVGLSLLFGLVPLCLLQRERPLGLWKISDARCFSSQRGLVVG